FSDEHTRRGVLDRPLSRTMTAESAVLSASTVVLKPILPSLRRDAGAWHRLRRGRMLPGRVGDVNRRERRTFDITAIARLGAQLAALPCDLAEIGRAHV